MTTTLWHRLASIAAIVAVVASVILFSCGKKADPANPKVAPDETYVVKGRVKALPDPNNPTSEFRVQHEAIDSFRAVESGKIVGMGSMEMSFALGKEASLEGIKVGDIVQMTWVVYRKPDYHTFVTHILKLPASVKLEFRAANPTAE